MPDGPLNYRHTVYNESGYILMYPQVAIEDDLLQSFPPNPYAESATQQFPLGTKLIQAERVWRYCKAGATGLNIGAPISSAPAVHADQQEDIASGVAAAIGAYVVSLTSTANLDGAPNDVKDTFKEGYLHVNDAAGQGQCYKIKTNEAFSGTAESLFTLYDPLTIATTTSSQFGLVMNPYKNVVVCPTAATMGWPCGVPGIAVTALYYFWSQTGGPASVVPQEAIALGNYAVVGTTAGKVNIISAVTTEFIIGWPLTPGIADTEEMMIFLTLDS
jgi:hypothetical protein